MAPFKTIVLVQFPVPSMWLTIREEMPQIANSLQDVESVTVMTRERLTADRLRLVNFWKLKRALPFSVGEGGQGPMGWTDDALWDDVTKRCDWSIRPTIFADALKCHGSTSYEPAMNGKGTRITFEGRLDVDGSAPSLGMTGRVLAGVLESIVGTLIPKNFRKTVEGASALLRKRPLSAPE